MIKKRTLISLLMLSFGIGCFSAFATETAAVADSASTSAPIYQKISAENLKSLAEKEVTSDTSTLNDLISDEKDFIDVIKEKVEAQFNLDPHTRRQAIFALLNKYEEAHPIQALDVLEDGTWKDLEMLCGPKTKPSLYLAAKIDRTVTEVGRAMLYRKIIQPTDKIEDLVKQQQIVKKLIEDEKLFNDLDNNLKNLAVPENIFLSFWQEDILSSLIQQSNFALPLENKVKLLKKITTWVNKSEHVLMSKSVVEEFFFLLSLSVLAATTVTIPGKYLADSYGNKIYPDWKTGSCKDAIEKFGKVVDKLNSAAPKDLDPLTMSGMIKNGLVLAFGENDYFKMGVRAVAFGFATYGAWTMFRWFRHGKQYSAMVQKKLSQLAVYVESLNNMVCALKRHEELCKLMPQISSLDEKIDELRTLNEDFDHLLNLLASNTFKGEYSYFSFWSRMRVAYCLMEQEKDKFDEIMIGIGELDAQMSIARFYKEMKGKRVECCFPEYQISADGMAFVDLSNFWHPCIDVERVVANSINIHGKNIVITGPNAGGKSTVMKGFVVSLIMAQALGIAPASSMKFTPFSKIITYMNITDDIAAGNSHFKAGVLRARSVLREVGSVKAGQHAIAVVDEIFNGTTFKEGQAAAFSFINELGQKPSNIVITTTHFPMMADLAKVNDKFLNYKVYVNYDQNGKILYTYKLEPGVSDQIVTLKILREEGFTDGFIDSAETVLESQS